jgi:hypothetical protein
MWSRKNFIASILLLVVLVPSIALVSAQAQFSVSPGQFTLHNVPPLGHPFTLPEKLVVYNNDNIPRLVLITSEIPPENETTSGYDPIPNENWITPLPSSVQIKENSFALIQLSLDIPRDENLTNQKWEVWIPVEREANPGEIGVLRPTVRIDIETASELPPLNNGASLTLIAVIVVIIIGCLAIGLVIWYRVGSTRRR